MSDAPRRKPRPVVARVAWIVVLIALGILCIEFGAITLIYDNEPLRSVGEIICGVLLVLVITRSALRIPVEFDGLSRRMHLMFWIAVATPVATLLATIGVILVANRTD